MLTGLGVKYLALYARPSMWRDFRPPEIDRDLQALRDAGVGSVRAFLLWPDFTPTPNRVEPQMLGRLETFVGLLELPVASLVHLFPVH